MTDADQPSGWTDLERPPLDPAALRRALVRDGSPWLAVDVVAATGSTNVDLATAAAEGRAVPGTVLVAEEQLAGRGRMERSWVSPARAGLTFSVLLAPTAAVARWGWLPLLAGLAVVDGVAAVGGPALSLKWPNDVLAADGRKVGGVLSERVEAFGTPYAVVGVGLNVTTRGEELPVATASSLALAGAEHTDRQPLLVSVLRELATRFDTWEDGLDPLEDYRAACSTLGRSVRIEVPHVAPVTGTAVDIDQTGRLVVTRDSDGTSATIAAGDVTHLR